MILFLTNADTEILALRSIAEGLPHGFPEIRAANPSKLGDAPSLDQVGAVVVRLLGGRRAWERAFDRTRERCMERGIPLLAFGGEMAHDLELAAASTADARVVSQAFEYLRQGGLANFANLVRFVASSVGMYDCSYEPPEGISSSGVFGTPETDPSRPTVGVVFYRAHLISGNTQFVSDLCQAIEAHGANALPVYCYSLRPDESGHVPAIELLADKRVNTLVTTVLASGSPEEGGDGWASPALASLDVPIVQAVTATASHVAWGDSSMGLSPTDVAMAVAIPELDGRIVSVPFSFKEVVDDGEELGSPVSAYRTVPDRVERVAGLATRLARLHRTPVEERRVAIVLSSYPTKRSRIGNAVGLDTPASAILLLRELRAGGYRVDRVPEDGDELMSELADALQYDEPASACAGQQVLAGRCSAGEYRSWFDALPLALRQEMTSSWGPPPGVVQTAGSDKEGEADFVFSGLDLGGVLVAVQPPRGFGENPVAVYHSPDLAPTHQYLAFYRWLDQSWGADAVVHLGKHGTLEWLPGKGVGLSASCAPDAVLGDLPLIYPFVVNDPGEGTQAKRRSHAVIVDHLIPPMTRADTYDDLARLETLLDSHAHLASLDPSKLPGIRRQIWELMIEAEIHRDLGMADDATGEDFQDDAFDALLLEVDGYLCELKDAQIRGGLHVLGQPPRGEAQLDLVLAMTRVPGQGVPSLRETVASDLGVDLSAGRREGTDRVEAECRRRLSRLQERGWRLDSETDGDPIPSHGDPTLAWVCKRLIPALRSTTQELSAVLASLSGRYVPAGPSGAPTRGMAHVLPTGRNFFSLDPRAVPSQPAWEVGSGLANALLDRHLSEEGRYPESVGLVVWGTSAMRTAGDDVALALALMGVRPRWREESGRVEGVEVVPLRELGRPRVDVTIRVSGFFRDAFPHVIDLLDDAVGQVSSLDEPTAMNFVRAHGGQDPRVFGPKPGAYGSGILTVLESGEWESGGDLAAVYLAWGAWSYGRGAMGVADPDAMRRRFASIDVAVKNQDNREHDIFDSDDYLQDHGGMVATMRSLRPDSSAKAWFGDSSDPARPRVRSLAEEAARVVRTRVVNPKWITAMRRHGYKGAFEMAATVDYLFGYDATAHVAEDWMYEKVTETYVADADVRKFFEQSNPWALRSIAERLLEARERGLWDASDGAVRVLRSALLEAEGWEEAR